MKALAALFATAAFCHAGQPQLHPLKASWDPYVVPMGVSNAVIVLYKSVYLGTGGNGPTYTPYKPTAYFPASRTNGTISVLPGTYHFQARAQGQPLPESAPSNTTTNTVAP